MRPLELTIMFIALCIMGTVGYVTGKRVNYLEAKAEFDSELSQEQEVLDNSLKLMSKMWEEEFLRMDAANQYQYCDAMVVNNCLLSLDNYADLTLEKQKLLDECRSSLSQCYGKLCKEAP